MSRVKRGVAAHKKHKKLLHEAEGRRGAKRKLVRPRGKPYTRFPTKSKESVSLCPS